MQGRPFVLLGVNGDQSREKAQNVIAKNRINWQSWFVGGPRAQVVKDYGVRSWPTNIVIDENGIIRSRGMIGEELDAFVDRLVQELEQSQRMQKLSSP